jgi:hypothetical protein
VLEPASNPTDGARQQDVMTPDDVSRSFDSATLFDLVDDAFELTQRTGEM